MSNGSFAEHESFVEAAGFLIENGDEEATTELAAKAWRLWVRPGGSRASARATGVPPPSRERERQPSVRGRARSRPGSRPWKVAVANAGVGTRSLQPEEVLEARQPVASPNVSSTSPSPANTAGTIEDVYKAVRQRPHQLVFAGE